MAVVHRAHHGHQLSGRATHGRERVTCHRSRVGMTGMRRHHGDDGPAQIWQAARRVEVRIDAARQSPRLVRVPPPDDGRGPHVRDRNHRRLPEALELPAGA